MKAPLTRYVLYSIAFVSNACCDGHVDQDPDVAGNHPCVFFSKNEEAPFAVNLFPLAATRRR